MFRIRFHGRGGQGVKTASRILGTAFFLSGYEAQDAPRYGAERRGAPIFAYVRADHGAILERGVIQQPDLVVVADDSLMGIPAAGVLAGLDSHAVLLINSRHSAETWRHRLNLAGLPLSLAVSEEVEDRSEQRYIGAACAGAAAQLTGVVPWACLEGALREELSRLPPEVVEKNVAMAQAAFEAMKPHRGEVRERPEQAASRWHPPAWIDLPLETAARAAPSIHAPLTSELQRTGLWRTMRPVLDEEHCNHCWWVCSTFCPDGAITVDEGGLPHIDYEHCKGCLICVAQCPPHAIRGVPEHLAQLEETP